MDELRWDFELVVPPKWYVYDSDPSTRGASTSAAVEERIRAVPELAPAREELIDMLLGFWSDADDEAALAAAVLWEPGSPAAIAANLTVVAYTDAPATLDELRASAEGATKFDVRDRVVTLVEVPAGGAVRVHGLRCSADGDDDSDLLIDVIEYWIPVPGNTDVLVLKCSTPCLDVADELAGEFDEIAEGLVFTEGA